MTFNRNIVELQEIDTAITEVPELVNVLNDNIVELNFILSKLTMGNFDGEIKTVTIPATSTLRIWHKLKVIPPHRSILRQAGGGVISDGVFGVNYIELKNDGNSPATLTIIIHKG
jgi:hypothetical protein